jgi:hypothetical protein
VTFGLPRTAIVGTIDRIALGALNTGSAILNPGDSY